MQYQHTTFSIVVKFYGHKRKANVHKKLQLCSCRAKPIRVSQKTLKYCLVQSPDRKKPQNQGETFSALVIVHTES